MMGGDMREQWWVGHEEDFRKMTASIMENIIPSMHEALDDSLSETERQMRYTKGTILLLVVNNAWLRYLLTLPGAKHHPENHELLFTLIAGDFIQELQRFVDVYVPKPEPLRPISDWMRPSAPPE